MKMKIVLSCLLATMLVTSAYAREKVVKPGEGGGQPAPAPAPKADNQDACGAALCLAGAAMEGKSPDSCNSYIQKYFEQQVITSSGFNPSKTLKAREKFLNQCKSSDQKTKDDVNNKYGKQQPF